MSSELPTVGIDELAEAAKESLQSFGESRYKLTHMYAVGDDGALIGQVSIVDLALADNATPVRSIASTIVAAVTARLPPRSARGFSVTTT